MGLIKKGIAIGLTIYTVKKLSEIIVDSVVDYDERTREAKDNSYIRRKQADNIIDAEFKEIFKEE